jgi:hypothetical protein
MHRYCNAALLTAAFFLVLSSADTSIAQAPPDGSPGDPSLGRSYEVPMDSQTYAGLVTLASCDWADPKASCEEKSCASIADSVSCRDAGGKWIATIGAGAAIGTTEPAIVFVGIGGANRIVFVGNKKKPHYRTLGGAEYLWAVFVEDSATPFQTSIDVQFRDRVAFAEYEEFDPAGVPPAAATGNAPRQVRIGYRRFRIRRAPTDVQVTFSRQGPAYGFRQWVRSFSVTGSTRAGVAVGLMAPGRLLKLREFDVVPLVGAAGDAPTALRIVDEGTSYRGFVVITKTWPRARDWVMEARGLGTVLGRLLITPEPQFGVGVPQDPLDTIFAGLSWPLYRPLRASMGMTRLRNQQLNDGLFVGQRVPFGNDERSIGTEVDVQWKLTVGLSIDVVRR